MNGVLIAATLLWLLGALVVAGLLARAIRMAERSRGRSTSLVLQRSPAARTPARGQVSDGLRAPSPVRRP